MRILAIGDIEGYIPKNFKRFVKEHDIDFIICTGDIGDDKEIRKIIFKHWMTRRWYDVVGIKRANQLLKRTYDTGVKVLKFLNSLNILVYFVFGNGDFYKMKGRRPKYKKYTLKNPGYYEDVVKNLNNLIFIHKKIVRINDLALVGHGGYVDPTIYLDKKIMKEDDRDWMERVGRYRKTEKEIFSIFKKKPKRFIFVTHYTPYKNKLDVVRNKSSPMNNKHVGLETYNKVDLKYNPLLHICGHMQENFGKIKIGKTSVVNPGALADNRCAIIEIKGSNVTTKLLKL